MASGGSADADTASAAVEQPCACTRMAAVPDALFHIDEDATLYELLGVTPDVGIAEIKQAYKARCMQWHPDRHSASSQEETEHAEKMFKEVGEAFEILSDPQKKEKYDAGMDVEEINGSGGGGGGGGGMPRGMDPMDIFAQMGGMGGMPAGFGGFGGIGGGMPRRSRGGMPPGF